MLTLGLAITSGLLAPRSGGGGGGGVPANFTLTAGDFSGILIGYQPDFAVGSISAEPIGPVDDRLDLFYSRTDTGKTLMQFQGTHAALLLTKTTLINGVPIVWETDWVELSGETAAQADGVLIPTVGDYAITWQPR